MEAELGGHIVAEAEKGREGEAGRKAGSRGGVKTCLINGFGFLKEGRRGRERRQMIRIVHACLDAWQGGWKREKGKTTCSVGRQSKAGFVDDDDQCCPSSRQHIKVIGFLGVEEEGRRNWKIGFSCPTIDRRRRGRRGGRDLFSAALHGRGSFV